jgi:hypothetical protein
MIGANINSYFRAAMNYPVERLVAVMQGKDQSIPQAAAMMALQIKKPMVDAAKGQEAMNRPQQPSVKEQMEQEVAMLPENVGIMNLPVEQEFADGGIVAFDKGGLTAEEQAELARRRREQISGFFGSLAEIPSNVMNYGRRAYETVSNLPFESKTPLIRYGKQDRTGIMAYEQAPEALARMRREEMDTGGGGYKGQDFGAAGAATPVAELTSSPEAPAAPRFVDARTTPPSAPSAGKGKGAGAAGPKKGEAGGPKKEATAASTFTPGRETDLATELAKVQNVMPDVERLYGGLSGDIEAAFAERARLREQGKPKDKAYEGLEKLLAKEEESAKGKEAKNFNMALVNAGLAIAGGKSQFALQNIAEGAQVGTKQYMAGLEKLEEAAKERRRQAAAIEEARRAEARGDWKDQQQFMDRAMEAGLNVKKAQVDAVVNITGKSVETASGIVNAQNQTVSQEKRALLQAETELERQRMADEAALQRVREQVAGQKAIYGGARDPVNIATDNAAKEYEIWQKSSAGKLAGMDQAKQDAAKRQIYNEVFKRSGLPLPYPVGGGVVPPPVGGGRFIGFETQ